jgi:hypothetical protein
MRKLLTISAFLFLNITVNGQVAPDLSRNNSGPSQLFLTSVNGEPFSTTKYAEVVSGSAFFSEKWMKGTGLLSNGQVFKAVPLRLNLLENRVHYKEENGQEMIANSPIHELKLTDTSSGETYSFVYSSFLSANQHSQPDCWLIPLQTGHIGLYKQIYKSISETLPYGSATAEQRIKTVTRYFLLKENEFKSIGKWQDLTELLSERKAEVQEYLRLNKLKGKSESDHISVVKFYNELEW